MSKLIIVAHPETKELFTKTSNPEWSKCQVREVGKISVTNGVIRSLDVSCFPLIQTKLAKSLNLKDGDNFPISGKIVRELSRTPFYDNQTTAKVSSESDAAEAMIESQPYYSQYSFVTDMSANDVQYSNWTEEVEEKMAIS